MRIAARKSLGVFFALILLLFLPGCWNYTEVDDMSIVAGVALDKAKDGKLQLTAEMVDIQNGLEQQSQAGFKMISLSGNTIFDIARNMISMTGKKLFWSHAKSIIFSEELAREGLVPYIDWYSRDTETRSDVFIFVSEEKNARDVLNLNSTTESVMSFELAQLMRDEKFVAGAPVVEIWDFIDKLEVSGQSAVAPLIHVHELNGQKNERVEGTAVFDKDRMVGKLDGKESKAMLFVKNKISGGVLEVEDRTGKPAYSLEILSSRTEVRPVLREGDVTIHLSTVTKTGLDEVMNTGGMTQHESLKDIEKRAGEKLRQDMLSVIHKVQREYHADIFGFGAAVHRKIPKPWKQMRDRWSDIFTDLEVTVDAKVIIESTAKTSRALKLGD